MRILWLSHLIPFPPRGGNLQRSFNLIRQAAASHEVTLVALNVDGERPARLSEYARELRKYCREVEFWEPPYSWKGVRWQVELLRSAALRAPFSCRARYSAQLGRKWQRTLARHPGAIVHIDAIDLAMFVPATDGFRRVLNHHNCESVLAFRRSETETNPVRKAYLRLEASKLAQWERAMLERFDVHMAVCAEDRERLLAIHPSAHIHLVENGVDTHYFRPGDAPEQPMTVIYTGSLNWEPNAAAARFFARNVWPQVRRRCPDARLHIAGREPPQDVVQLGRAGSGIAVFPSPDDIRPLMRQASVYVCPIREGAGTRLKILDAMAMGKAVVSTGIGCEGLRVRSGRDVLIADGPEEMAGSVCRLLVDETQREQLGRSARELVEREYAWERIGRQLEDAYRCAAGVDRCGTRAAQERGARDGLRETRVAGGIGA